MGRKRKKVKKKSGVRVMRNKEKEGAGHKMKVGERMCKIGKGALSLF